MVPTGNDKNISYFKYTLSSFLFFVTIPHRLTDIDFKLKKTLTTYRFFYFTLRYINESLVFVRPTNIVISRLTLELRLTNNILSKLQYSEILVL